MGRLSDWLDAEASGTAVDGAEDLAPQAEDLAPQAEELRAQLDTWLSGAVGDSWAQDGSLGLAEALDLIPGWQGWDDRPPEEDPDRAARFQELRDLLADPRKRIALIPPGHELALNLDASWLAGAWRDAGGEPFAYALDQLPGWAGWEGNDPDLATLTSWLIPLPVEWTGEWTGEPDAADDGTGSAELAQPETDWPAAETDETTGADETAEAAWPPEELTADTPQATDELLAADAPQAMDIPQVTDDPLSPEELDEAVSYLEDLAGDLESQVMQRLRERAAELATQAGVPVEEVLQEIERFEAEQLTGLVFAAIREP